MQPGDGTLNGGSYAFCYADTALAQHDISAAPHSLPVAAESEGWAWGKSAFHPSEENGTLPVWAAACVAQYRVDLRAGVGPKHILSRVAGRSAYPIDVGKFHYSVLIEHTLGFARRRPHLVGDV